jgi:hypothetical protein
MDLPKLSLAFNANIIKGAVFIGGLSVFTSLPHYIAKSPSRVLDRNQFACPSSGTEIGEGSVDFLGRGEDSAPRPMDDVMAGWLRDRACRRAQPHPRTGCKSLWAAQ